MLIVSTTKIQGGSIISGEEIHLYFHRMCSATHRNDGFTSTLFPIEAL